jgi:hypothetical protein
MKWLIFLVCLVSAHAQDQSTLFQITAFQRGHDIANMVTTLTTNPIYTIPQSEVGIQTTGVTAFLYAPGVVNGFIPFVQKVTLSPFGTYLTVQYQPRGLLVQYLVVPIEDVGEVVYSTQTIATSGFSSTIATGIYPLLSIDPGHRASDVASVVLALQTTAPFKTATSQVGIQTTLSGPFYPSIQNGFLPNIQQITLLTPGSTLLLIQYQNLQFVKAWVVVAAEQVQQIVYTPFSF